jgi:hypothetical protein
MWDRYLPAALNRRTLTLFAIFCAAYTVLLVVLKERGIIRWPWGLILAPVWIYLTVLAALFGYFVASLIGSGS